MAKEFWPKLIFFWQVRAKSLFQGKDVILSSKQNNKNMITVYPEKKRITSNILHTYKHYIHITVNDGMKQNMYDRMDIIVLAMC